MRPVLNAVLTLGLVACSATAPVMRHAVPSQTTPSLAIAELGIAELQARMQAGTLDSRHLVQASLDRIEAIDRNGPRLNSIIAINPEALAEADGRDAERRAGRVRGPLHGIPVLLKDNIDAVPMATTAGSLALADNTPARDAFLVRQLREAGAVILGKTNLSEWANFRSTRATSGWSGVGGQTRNPYVLDRNPCGSSSGTGSAIAASLAPVGIGTETDGSIICPSSVAGLVGIKPSIGRVSRDGIVPIAISQDTAGPMARSVADAIVLLEAIAVDDADDPASAQARAHPIDYRDILRSDALRGARIGVLRDAMGYHPDVDAAMEHAIALLRAAGATVIDAHLPSASDWNEAEMQVLLHEFKDGLERYFASHGTAVRSFADLIAFNRAHAEREMPWFGQELLERAADIGPLSDPVYLDAQRQARELAGARGIDAALAAARLDALIAPATAPAWPTDPLLGDHVLGEAWGAAAVAGYPSVTVPMAMIHELPVGLVFMGPAWSDARLIGFAYAFEQASQARRAPRLLPTLEADAGSAGD